MDVCINYLIAEKPFALAGIESRVVTMTVASILLALASSTQAANPKDDKRLINTICELPHLRAL